MSLPQKGLLSSAGTKTGYLVKLGGKTKTWKKRFFVLSKATLKYYTDEKIDELRGTVEIDGCQLANPSQEEMGKDLVIALTLATTERKYLLVASSREDFEGWWLMLEKASMKHKDRNIKEGKLKKQGRSIKTWKTRYFVLTPHSLQYYKREGDKQARKQCSGEIQLLCGAAVAYVSDQEFGSRFVFSVTPDHSGRRYVLLAESDQDMRDWVKAIQALLRDEDKNKLRISVGDDPSNERASKGSDSAMMAKYTHTRTRAGWLKKQGHVVKNWKHRYFVLSGPVLWYFKEEEHATPQGYQKGMRSIGSCLAEGAVSEVEDETAFTFSVTPKDTKRKYIFTAPSAEEMHGWIDSFSGPPATPSPSPGGTRMSKSINLNDLTSSTANDSEPLSSPASNEPARTSGRESKNTSMSGDDSDSTAGTHSASGLTTAKSKSSGKFNLFSKNSETLPDVEPADYVVPDSRREGWMFKLVRSGRTVREKWHKRYFILNANTLCYWKGPPKKASVSKPRGTFDLQGATCVLEHKSATNLSGRPFVIAVKAIEDTARIPLLVSLTSDAQLKAWLSGIHGQIAESHTKHVESSNNTKEGYLLRLVGDNKWTRHYYVLPKTPSNLIVYSTHTLKNGSISTFALAGFNIQMHPNGTYENNNAFSLTNDVTEWVCAADSRQDLDGWVDVIMALD